MKEGFSGFGEVSEGIGKGLLGSLEGFGWDGFVGFWKDFKCLRKGFWGFGKGFEDIVKGFSGIVKGFPSDGFKGFLHTKI